MVLAQAALLANDTDAEGDFLAFLTVASPTNGVVTVVTSDVQFTAPANYSGPASFEYTVSDGTQSSTGIVTLTILQVHAGRPRRTGRNRARPHRSQVLHPVRQGLTGNRRVLH